MRKTKTLKTIAENKSKRKEISDILRKIADIVDDGDYGKVEFTFAVFLKPIESEGIIVSEFKVADYYTIKIPCEPPRSIFSVPEDIKRKWGNKNVKQS